MMDKKCKIVLVALAVIMVGALVYCAINISPKTVDPQAEVVASAKKKLKTICNRFGTLAIDFPREKILFQDPGPQELKVTGGSYYQTLDLITICSNNPKLEETLALTHELIHAQCSNFGKENYSAFWLEGMASLISSAGFNPEELKACRMEFANIWGLNYGTKIVYIYRVAELIAQKTSATRDKVVNQLIKLFLQNDTHMFDEYIDSALGGMTCKNYFKGIRYEDPFSNIALRQEETTIAKLYARNGVGKVHIEFPNSLFATPAAKQLVIDNYDPKGDL